MLRADIESVLVSREQIEQKVTQLGRQITSDYQGKEIILACILRGSFIFAADLARHIDVPMTIEFLSASSYAKGTEITGNVQIRQDFEVDISGKHVLLVEDIIDTGLTLSRLRQMLGVRNPASLKIVTLLDKPERRRVDITPDYCGFTIPDKFVVGYGLDYNNLYRNLPEVCILKEELYK